MTNPNMSNHSIIRPKDIRPAPAEIEYKGMKFLITDRPSDQTIQYYVAELKKHNVQMVVRVCEPTYSVDELKKENIDVTDLAYDDGTSPPNEVIEEWFEVLKTRFKEKPEACIAVHCVAGLGRAPVLVALALIELGMKYEDAVELIRQYLDLYTYDYYSVVEEVKCKAVLTCSCQKLVPLRSKIHVAALAVNYTYIVIYVLTLEPLVGLTEVHNLIRAWARRKRSS